MRLLLIASTLTAIGLVSAALWGAVNDPQPYRSKKTVIAKQEIPSSRTETHVAAVATVRDDTLSNSKQGEVVSGPQAKAVATLRQAMQSGDPRTPPLPKQTRVRDKPTAEELADPKLYQAYERRQKQQIYASFVAAASGKISELEERIALAAGGEVSPQQLAEAEKKLHKLKEQRELLLQQHPELQQQATENQ